MFGPAPCTDYNSKEQEQGLLWIEEHVDYSSVSMKPAARYSSSELSGYGTMASLHLQETHPSDLEKEDCCYWVKMF